MPKIKRYVGRAKTWCPICGKKKVEYERKNRSYKCQSCLYEFKGITKATAKHLIDIAFDSVIKQGFRKPL